MSYLMQSFTQGVSEGRQAMITRVNTALAVGTRLIISATVQRFYSTRNNEHLKIRILYNDTLGNSNVATYIEGTASSTLEQSFTAFQTANPTAQVLVVLDLTNRTPRSVDRGAVCAITTTTIPQTSREVYVAEALGNIVAGGTHVGAAKLYNSNGVLVNASVPIINGSLLSAWPQGQRNLVVYDATSDALIGVPSCCGTGNPLP